MQPLALLMAAYLFLLGGPKDVKEAVKLNGECLKKMPKPGQANSDEFINCVLKLEDLVTKVAEDRHIDLLKCKPNPADPSKNLAWCPVWAWWHKTEVMVTNPDLVQAIRDKKDITAIEPTKILKLEDADLTEMKPVYNNHVALASKGGVLDLEVTVTIGKDLHLNPDAPPKWLLYLPSGWKSKESESRKLHRKWALTSSGNPTDTPLVVVKCRLFYCTEANCMIRELAFSIDVNFNEAGSRRETHNIDYHFDP